MEAWTEGKVDIFVNNRGSVVLTEVENEIAISQLNLNVRKYMLTF